MTSLNSSARAALLGLMLFVPMLEASSQEPETLDWLSDYGEALALAKASGRPLLVEFRCAP